MTESSDRTECVLMEEVCTQYVQSIMRSTRPLETKRSLYTEIRRVYRNE